jgi:hypothetical protein
MGRLVSRSGRVLPALVCALAAHAAGYRSLTPGDGSHGYLGWYELLVSVMSASAVLLLLVGLAAVLLGRGNSRLDALARRPASASLRKRFASLAAVSLALLLVQETLERSLADGRPEAPALSLATWLVALGAIGIVAALIALADRSCIQLVEAALAGSRSPLPAARTSTPWPCFRASRRPRRSVLSELRLRAPPLVA